MIMHFTVMRMWWKSRGRCTTVAGALVFLQFVGTTTILRFRIFPMKMFRVFSHAVLWSALKRSCFRLECRARLRRRNCVTGQTNRHRKRVRIVNWWPRYSLPEHRGCCSSSEGAKSSIRRIKQAQNGLIHRSLRWISLCCFYLFMLSPQENAQKWRSCLKVCKFRQLLSHYLLVEVTPFETLINSLNNKSLS